MKRNNIILCVCTAALAAMCGMSIYSPIRFDKERTAREKIVKQRLMVIRDAEERYLKANGTYTSDFSELTAKGYMADTMRFIPFANGKSFALTTGMHNAKSGRKVPVMECRASYKDYLSGLDKNDIRQLTRRAAESGDYPGLTIGDMLTPDNNIGNWE